MKEKVYNRRASHSFLFPPVIYRLLLRLTHKVIDFVQHSRGIIEAILAGKDPRLMVIVGPCSIHNYDEAIEYARLIKKWQARFPHLFFVMRVYLEKPRTDVGWKGFFNDPDLDGSCRIGKGIWLSRKLLLAINKMGVPVGTEFLEPGFPTYLAGLVSWAAIGARTSESQIHRQMASGLSMPVGLKNTCNGDVDAPICGMVAARNPQVFMGYNQWGFAARIETSGNESAHLILRGGSEANYKSKDVTKAKEQLREKNLPQALIVDCSHANSGKVAFEQVNVAQDVVEQICSGENVIKGIMLESHHRHGQQKLKPGSKLKFGTSITDECLGAESTEYLLTSVNEAMSEHVVLKKAA